MRVSYWSAFEEEFEAAGIAKQTPDRRAKIDAVLFALWAQGHLERSRLDTLWMMPLSWAAGGLVGLFNLPAAVIRRLPEIALAAILTGLFAQSLNGIGSVDAGAGFFLALILLLRHEVLGFVRNILFDVGDFFTFGSLSRRYARRHLAIGPLTILDDADGLKVHLFTSRVLTSGTYADEATAFHEMVARKVPNWSEIKSVLDSYWEAFPVEETYWREKLSQRTQE